MKISTGVRYGVRMVVTLAQKGELMSTASLAKEMGVSPLYLRQLARHLEKKGIIKGFRGAKGGYILNVRAGEITIFEVIRALDEDFSLLDCIKSADYCSQGPVCASRYLWKQLSDSLKNIARGTTLQELVENANRQDRRETAGEEYVI